MADLYGRLPLLLLVALLLLIVVVFHICFLGRVPGRKQTRRTPKRSTKMDKLQTKTTMSVGGGGSSRQRCNSAEGGRRSYDPMLYSHLPSHEIPLPPSDDDVDDPRSSTVPLGSGSTQDWMGSQVYRHASTPTYTDLLEGRTPAGYDAGLVDLSFSLRQEVRRRIVGRRRNKKQGFLDSGAYDSSYQSQKRPGHLAGLGHNYGRMKTKTWKWEDVEKRLVQMGVTSRKAVDCGKKWDNLYEQFKSVHKFMGESRKPNFFTLTPGERRERGFDLRMDERMCSEMKAMSGGDHTIHPTNLADTGASGGVQLPGTVGGRNESGGSDVGGGGQDDDRGSTRDSSFSGGGGGGAGKRKNVRQQTFEAMTEVIKEHGALMSTTVDSASKRQRSILTRQCDILEREIQVSKDHYEKADQANFMICNALMEIAKAIRERA
ncbi:hypothetical protein CBR_g55241 [Chara braunii]|uniref:Myb-like domain-containing protein n=1 Tax=Chara braunii TaxID=69332 RepID=A0A388MCR8_CHABU|nr:hypothetical protein CBR_g55241 [Chara braunii]|eukprot:GBG92360.1 hypothetical protein CBR_g55241 [Chara braunii]